MKETSEKQHMTPHNVTVLRKSRARKAFGKGISNYDVCAEWDQLHDAGGGGSIELPTIMNTHVDVARRFTVHRIGRHGNTSQIVLINVSRVNLRRAYIQ